MYIGLYSFKEKCSMNVILIVSIQRTKRTCSPLLKTCDCIVPSERDTCLEACSDKSCHFEQVALVSTELRRDLNLPQNNSSHLWR